MQCRLKIWLSMCLLTFTKAELNSYNSCYNILILTSPLAGISHSIYLDEIAKELASKGHQITHFCQGNTDDIAGVRHFEIKAQTNPEEFLFKSMFEMSSIQHLTEKFFKMYPAAVLDAINATYNDPLIINLLEQPLNRVSRKPRYDVILIDSFMNEIYLPIVHHIGVPSILVSSTLLLPSFAWKFDVPYPYFLNFLGLAQPTSVLARTTNFLLQCASLVFLEYYISWKISQFMPLILSNKFKSSLGKLVRNASFMFTANPYSTADAIPTTPHVVNLGCGHCRPPMPLPKDLENILNNSGEHGVIYYSMGSIIKSNWISNDFENKIITVLRELPQTILLKGKLRSEMNFSNFYIRDWFPQQDILAHPKLKLVISSGGIGTVHEVSYHGAPILGFPLGNDQFYAMKVAKENGLGEILNWKTFSTRQLNQTINKMLLDKSYKTAAKMVSIRMKDVIASPPKKAAYWTEYIIRHNGANFLKNEAQNLSLYQYFLLDVLFLIAATLAGAITLFLMALKFSLKVMQFGFQLFKNDYTFNNAALP